MEAASSSGRGLWRALQRQGAVLHQRVPPAVRDYAAAIIGVVVTSAAIGVSLVFKSFACAEWGAGAIAGGGGS
ncbi:MAG: hypothetical protein ACHQ4H_13160 [Ktedonobacterales bacterium]